MHIEEMNKYEIDFELLFKLMWDTPADYDILDVKFDNGNIQIITSYDYKRVSERKSQQQKADSKAEFEKTLNSFIATVDKHFDDVQKGILPEHTPKRKRGRPRKSEINT